MYRVFVSHASADISFVRQLTDALATEHVHGFLAPLDVPPARQWVIVLERELRRCDALIAVITASFRSSKWCDQEVGYALGRGRVVVPVRVTADDPTPYGLLARFQAVTANHREPSEVAVEIFDALLTHKTVNKRLVDIVIEALATERDTERVRRWVDRLASVQHLLDAGRRARVGLLVEQSAAVRLDRNAYSKLCAILE